MARRRNARSRSKARRNLYKNYQGYFIVGLIFVAVALFAFTTGDGFSGFAATKNVGLFISVGNNDPFINDISAISSQNPTEATFTSVVFTFNATDPDGAAQLTNPDGFFNLTGATTRSNLTCVELATVNATTKEYECTINMYYFDDPGTWTVNATIDDNQGATKSRLETFTFNQLVAIVLSPTNLTWDSLALSDQNKTANNDPTQINNTGNSDNNLSVTAFDLHGVTVTKDRLNAVNFTVDVQTVGACSGPACVECDGTLMANNTEYNITNATLPKGNFSVPDTVTGKEQFYYCLLELNDSISSQAYSSSFLGPWIVTANPL